MHELMFKETFVNISNIRASLREHGVNSGRIKRKLGDDSKYRDWQLQWGNPPAVSSVLTISHCVNMNCKISTEPINS